MSEPNYLSLARSYIGLHEGTGDEDNPTVVSFYAAAGHPEIKHDAVAWCAAFVGAMLERSGIKSTRSLAARSYLRWGKAVELSHAEPGDVVVFKRGNSTWQGHVAFYISHSGRTINVLGGNQADRVSIEPKSVDDLLGIRRPTSEGD